VTGDPIQDNLRGEHGNAPLPRVAASVPSFAIAFGVDAGRRTVSVQEWQWPELPSQPERARLDFRK
jgi:hypothetical protein